MGKDTQEKKHLTGHVGGKRHAGKKHLTGHVGGKKTRRKKTSYRSRRKKQHGLSSSCLRSLFHIWISMFEMKCVVLWSSSLLPYSFSCREVSRDHLAFLSASNSLPSCMVFQDETERKKALQHTGKTNMVSQDIQKINMV